MVSPSTWDAGLANNAIFHSFWIFDGGLSKGEINALSKEGKKIENHILRELTGKMWVFCIECK